MNNHRPWLTQKSLRIVDLLLKSYQQAFKGNLITTKTILDKNHPLGEMVFNLKNPVMAHDNAKDPCLNYANAAALQLWERDWKTMIGMPSRLTAPLEERQKRENALKQVKSTHAIKDYQGIRVNSKGEQFLIRNASVWTLWNKSGMNCGQAATFEFWNRI